MPRTSPKRARLAPSAACLLLLTLSGCPQNSTESSSETGAKPATTPAPPALAVGLAIPSYVHGVAWIGQDQGHFRAAGVSIDPKVMGGSAATLRTLIAEGIDVGLAGGDAVVKANRAGADLIVVGGLVDRFYHRLVVPKSIAKPEDLRGKSLGLAIRGGPQEMAARFGLESLGLKADEDVTIRSMGKEFNRLASVSRGDVQATISQTPPSRLEELGLKVLVDLPAQEVRFPYAVVVTRRAFLEAHPERVRAFLSGLRQAVRFYKDEANKSACLAILAKNLSSSDTQAAAEERYRTGGPAMITNDLIPSEEGFRTVLGFLEIKDKQPSDYLDLSLVKALADAPR
jgi:sulfonate transport system substrate-binding protein